MAKKQIEQTEIEVPYELPEGWKWVKASDIANIYTGNSINEEVKRKKYTNISEGLNFIGTKDVDFDGTINYENGVKISDYENFKTVPANTPLLCIEGGSSGKKIGITNEQVCFGNKLCAFVCNETNPKLIYYFLQTNIFFYLFMKERHGLIGGVSVGSIKNIPIPLPQTLEEQQRIVNRIETLFAKLDQAKEKAQNVVDTFETRKASILHKAFTGELTKKWREENGVGDDSWEIVHLEDICEKIVCGKTPTGYITPQGEVPYLKVYNIVNNEIDFEITPQFIPKSINSGKLASSILKPYDVIMNIVGPPLRKIAIIPNTYPEWNMNQAIVRFRAKENLNPKYLYYGLVNPETLEPVIAETRGVVGQQNISVSQSRALELNVPTLPEQVEIVRILDVILEKENKANESAKAVLEQIDLLKKSILARAFRGEI